MGFRMGSVEGRAVLAAGDMVYDVGEASGGGVPAEPVEAIVHHLALHELTARLGADGSLAARGLEPLGRCVDVVLGPPVPWPRQVFGVGLNYRTHAEETGMGIPDAPLVFTKFPGCLSGPTADIELASTTTDYEAELVVVIGACVKDVPVADAWGVVAGLTVGQDISDRALQNAGARPQFSLGKSHDGYGPTGPFVVSPDLVADRDDLAVRGAVNGDVRQSDTTANLIFGVAELVSYLSSILTLYPGDLIFTGTPSGVGMATGDFLRPGDAVTTTIEGIGTLTNRCV